MIESVLQKQLEPLSPGIHLAGDGRVTVWRGQTGVTPHPHTPPEGTQTPLRVGQLEWKHTGIEHLDLGHSAFSSTLLPELRQESRRAFSGESEQPKKINPKIQTLGEPQWNCPASEDTVVKPHLCTQSVPPAFQCPAFKYKQTVKSLFIWGKQLMWRTKENKWKKATCKKQTVAKGEHLKNAVINVFRGIK